MGIEPSTLCYVIAATEPSYLLPQVPHESPKALYIYG